MSANQFLLNFLICMKLRPLDDRLIVEAVTKEAKTASGIIIPDTAKEERPEQGVIVSVGPGKIKEDGSRHQMSVKVGDTVVFKKYSPDEIKIDGTEYLILAESDILAVIE